MKRVYVLGLHDLAWGCHGCVEAWRQARRDVADGKDAPPWAMVGELRPEDVRRFRVFGQGRRIKHEEGGHREGTRLYVRPVAEGEAD